MAVGLLAAIVPKPFCLLTTKLQPSSLLTTKPAPLFAPLGTHRGFFNGKNRRKLNSFTVCFVLEEKKQSTQIETFTDEEEEESGTQISTAARVAEKLARKRSERFTYLVAAVMSSFGITSMAVMAVYYRFWWQMEGGEVPLAEMFGTFALSVGAAVGMEFWARWAHKALWHASLWHMHESHHRPREGPFELNDVFAIINAVPAIALLSFGFFHKGLVPGLCFGALLNGRMILGGIRDLALRCLGWPTCSSTMVSFTKGSLWVPLPTCLISGESLRLTSFTTRINSTVFHMGSFSDLSLS
ncbi:Beta-carotene 3-hydroxylase 2 [Citrus sinensis]|nr:Beta-carotene 3-hydroxylase 2 [Citrus sinensis]